MTWYITGNQNIDTTKFLGTTNDQPLVIKTNQLADDSEKVRVNPDGNVGIGKAPGAYKLDVAGAINATDILKNGSSVVSSQWTAVPKGLKYAAGSVGIGKAPGAYKLDVAGAINATDILKNGAPLSVSQWTDVPGGIDYPGGNVGIGTAGPLYRLHVLSPGGFGGEDSDGLSLAGNVPLVAQSDSTAIGVINGDGRQAFALNIDGNGGATNSRGVPTLYDKYDGAWHQCLSLKNGNVGIGTYDPTHRFHVRAAEAVGLFESTGGQAYLRLSTSEGLNNRVEITNRPGGRLSLWTAGAGDVFNVTRGGNVGIGTTTPEARLVVTGGDIRLEGGRTFYSPGRLHVHGEEILYLLNKAGVNISRAWGGSGNLHVDGEVRLGAGNAPVHIGGNRTGPILQLNDDLWFSDPQDGSIWIRNHNDSTWGTMVGNFRSPSSLEYKKDTSVLKEPDLAHLLDDALETDVVRYRYKGDEETSRLRLGVIAEECPEYLVGEGGKSLSPTEYTAMLHGAIKALAERLATVEKRLSV